MKALFESDILQLRYSSTLLVAYHKFMSKKTHKKGALSIGRMTIEKTPINAIEFIPIDKISDLNLSDLCGNIDESNVILFCKGFYIAIWADMYIELEKCHISQLPSVKSISVNDMEVVIADLSKKLCMYCYKKGANQRCSKCLRIKYCGPECQMKHWEYHKDECEAINFSDYDTPTDPPIGTIFYTKGKFKIIKARKN